MEQIDTIMDGHYFIKLLDSSTDDINYLCKKYQIYVDQSSSDYVSNEDVLGQIQTTIGKAQLLINQKFKQFRGLCQKNIRDKSDASITLNEGEFVTRDEDLAGFWDMVCLQIEDINRMFNQLEELKKNDWKVIQKSFVRKPEIKKKINDNVTSSYAAARALNPGISVNESSKNSSTKLRSEAARQRLLEAKKNAALMKQKELNQNVDIAIFDAKK